MRKEAALCGAVLMLAACAEDGGPPGWLAPAPARPGVAVDPLAPPAAASFVQPAGGTAGPERGRPQPETAVAHADPAATARTLPAIDGRTAWSGPVSAAALDLTMTARDERSWRILWQLVGRPAPSPLPEGAMALAVFLGPRATGGHSVAFTEVVPEERALVVRYAETRPPPGAAATQQVTAPYAILIVPETERRVEYHPIRP